MIIGISGKKQAGKDTACNFISSYRLLTKGILEEFKIDEYGKTRVCEEGEDIGEYDIRAMQDFNAQVAWQFARVFSFADELKALCMNYFGLSFDQCYGNNEDKNSLTKIRWENMPYKTKKGKKGFMTSRELLQVFGTGVMRKVYDPIWSEVCISNIRDHLDSIETKGQCLCLVSDVRFPNEVEAIQATGGKVIRLTRDVFPDDTSDSEHALDEGGFDWDRFDYVLDNSEIPISEQNNLLYNKMVEWKVFQDEVEIKGKVTTAV